MEDTAIAIARHPTHINRKNNVNLVLILFKPHVLLCSSPVFTKLFSKLLIFPSIALFHRFAKYKSPFCTLKKEAYKYASSHDYSSS